MSTVWIDANVILRFLLNDHPEQSKRAQSLFESAHYEGTTLRVTPFILAEVIYVLAGTVYGYSRADIVTSLLQLAGEPAVSVDDSELVLQALIDYRDLRVDFADALLMAYARRHDSLVVTFNRRDFAKLSGDWSEP